MEPSTALVDSNTTDKLNQKEFFKLIESGKEDLCIQCLNEHQLDEIDCVDEHGMTALQYASYRGLQNLVKVLIKNGANVNANTHDQGYSALMFASIANHKNVVQILLENDANIDAKNQIGRTASQMAAFVNSNECVDVINNYISKADIEYFTKTHSINETEPKLPLLCVNDLHKLLTGSNLKPTNIIKRIFEASSVFMPHIVRIIKTLDAFVERAFNKHTDEVKCPNDVLAFKLHYHKFIFEYIKHQFECLKTSIEKSNIPLDTDENLYKTLFDTIMKRFLSEELVPESKSYFRIFEEKFIREAIRQFPYKECALLRQMVQILFKVKLGSDPTALYVVDSCLFGQKWANPEDDDEKKVYACETCSQKHAKLCSRCKKVSYCDQFCQRQHWFIHKKQCNIKSSNE